MMRLLTAGLVLAQLVFAGPAHSQPSGKAAPSGKDSTAADQTRNRLLKTKVTGDFKDVTLRDLLKALAAQVEMQTERPVMWTYMEGVPAADRVSIKCKDQSLDEVLDEVFAPRKLGYIVISDDDGPRDGWVRITRGSERGYAVGAAPPTAAEEEKAAGTLALAQGLIDKGKSADARAILMLVVTKYGNTKAAAEARKLLEKLGK